MGRPQRNNADYFPHFTNDSARPHVVALRQRYGAEGYGVYTMLREQVCAADHFRIELSETTLKVYAGVFGVGEERFEEMLEYMVSLGLLQQSDSALWCQDLVRDLEPLLEKRTRMREIRSTHSEAPVTGLCDTNAHESAQTPQSKEEESKGEESRVVEEAAETAPESEAPKEPRNDYERVEAHFAEAYRELYHVEPAFNFGQNRQLLKPLLKLNGLESVNAAIDEAKTDKWIQEHHAFDLPTILSARLFNRLLRTALEKQRAATESDWSTVEVFSIFPEVAHVNN